MKFTQLLLNSSNNLFIFKSVLCQFFSITKSNLLKSLRIFFSYLNNIFSLSFLINLEGFENSVLNQVSIPIDHIKTQELTFLAEYFLITALFCLTLFALFSLKLVVDEKHFLIKFQYNNQLIFLLIFGLACYLILVYQQIEFSLFSLTSFNGTICNDMLSITAKLIIGISSIFYLIFITQYLSDQKLSNFEYYIILLTSIFGFFLLCGANDLITAYLAIELQGLAFYVLASFKKSSNFSIESGVKYFVLGSLSTAIFLLGITFVYGLSGSVFLTDFRDLFIWVFSANSFFLSFSSISDGMESFQKKMSFADLDSDSVKLQAIFDKLELFKQKAHLVGQDSNLLLANSNNINTESNLIKNISDEMLSIPNQIDAHSYWYYKDSLNDSQIYKVVNDLWLLPNFFLESTLQDASVELSYSYLQNNMDNLDYDSFKNVKEVFSNMYLYEDEIMSSTSGSSSFYQLNNNLTSADDILDFCNVLQCFAVSSEMKEIESSLNLNLLSDLANSFFVSNNVDYMFSVTNISSLSEFLNLGVDNVGSQNFMFDFSFVVSGMLIILFALFFKLALAPFHLWAPDVYEGSPSSSTFFFMIISKFSIFILLLRICYSSFYSLISYWQFYSLLVATTSIFVGAVAGLKQRRLKSLLTYSSINNMGFVLLAFSIGGFEGVQIKFFYLMVYILSGLCTWSIVLHLKLKKKMYFEKQNLDLGDLALLQESNNVVAQNLAIILFTLAGIPPMVGFLAKMGVFKALSGVSIYFFSFTNILFSVIATFYYIRIVKIIFFENLLVGNLYASINTKKTFIINLLTFLLVFLFTSPMLLYFYSYKVTLFLNKSFY